METPIPSFIANLSYNDLNDNYKCIYNNKNKKIDRIDCVSWFVPSFDNPLRGGIRTILYLAEKFSIEFGTLNIIIICTSKNVDLTDIEYKVHNNFPKLNFILNNYIYGKTKSDDMPFSQISFCTLWTTAYVLAKYNKTYKKFYLVQDYEPLFYEAGSLSVIIEHSYRLGFNIICNTQGVKYKCNNFTKDVSFFTPGVDSKIFYNISRQYTKPYRIVFYGRPNNARNCFSLGILTLKALKRKLKTEVEIFSVGAEWNPEDLGLKGIVKNLGVLTSLNKIADIYRKSDIGLVYMATPHPSYQPFEYMACGCVVATNINENNFWMLNEENSLLIPPIPDAAAQKILECLQNIDLRRKIVTNGLELCSQFTWIEAYNTIKRKILN